MSRIQYSHSYSDLISLDNLLEAWKEFKTGKKFRSDVQEFEQNLLGNIINLHNDLLLKTYCHSKYEAFKITDPKPRDIHKASVRDRLLHHAIYRKLYPFFDRTFIADSFSCRFNKGTHKALQRLQKFANKVSQNNTKTTYVLKCDVRKFFASIDQVILINILKTYIMDSDILWLIKQILNSFCTAKVDIGLPLGNLTSQLLVNIYMNEFDQFMKHKLKVKYYIRYADDFVIMSNNKSSLNHIPFMIDIFLDVQLHLKLHPDKVFIKSLGSGIDFLGWVHFVDYRVLRTSTKNRVFKKLSSASSSDNRLQSYLGLLKHGQTFKIKKEVEIF